MVFLSSCYECVVVLAEISYHERRRLRVSLSINDC